MEEVNRLERPRGRWAPSPTGFLHVGNARTALAAWASVRSRNGTFVWRLEDLDPPRIVEGAAEAAMAELEWLGLDWDEDPDRGGPFAPYVQSERSVHYEAALTRLAAAGRLFPCDRSRRDLRELATAPHGGGGTPPYPPSLRPTELPEGWLERFRRQVEAHDPTDPPVAALRFLVHDEPVTFDDRVEGPLTERVSRTVGDFVLRRRDGLYAYQLAVVVDDLLMEIDDVVRGRDLLGSTARQIQLLAALGGRVPAYAHVPLVLNAAGEKLSKRDEGLTLASLRAEGVDPRRLVGYLAWSLGWLDRAEACTPADLLDGFDWARTSRKDWMLPENLPELLSR